MAEAQRIGLGRARRDDRPGAVEAEGAEQRGVVEQRARQSGPFAQGALIGKLARADLARREINRLARDEGAAEFEPGDEVAQALDRHEAAAIGLRRLLEAVERRQPAQRLVDLPLQHGGAGCRAAETLALAVDDDDLMAECRQVLGGQRAGDAAADDHDVAADIGVEPLRSPGAAVRRTRG